MGSELEQPEGKAWAMTEVAVRCPETAEGVLRSRLDPPLDDAGKAEAAVLGDLFVDGIPGDGRRP